MSLLQNGSFELGPNPGDYLPLSPGSKDISGWDVIGGGIDYYGTGWVASDGNRSLDLNGTPGIGGVAQTFATTPGEKYHVNFDLAGHNSGLLQTMRVSAAGESADFSFQSGTDPNHLGWQGKTWDFTATAPQTTLNFESLQTGYEYGGPALDNVVVTPGGGNVAPGLPDPGAAAGGDFEGGNLRLTVAGPTVDTPALTLEAKVTSDGVEFPLLPQVTGEIGTVVPVQIDLLDDKIDFDFSRAGSGHYTPAPGGFNGYVFDDINNSLPPIVGVDILEGNTSVALENNDVAFSEDRITVNVEDLAYDPSSTIQLDVAFLV